MAGGGGQPSYAYNNPDSASNVLAKIIAQQYSNYQSMFVPEENKLIKYATDPNTVPNAQKRAMGLTEQSFNAGNAGFNKGLETSNINMTPQQKASTDRQRQITQQLATVDSANRSGVRTFDSVTGILSGAQSAAGIVPSGGGSGAPAPGTGIG